MERWIQRPSRLFHNEASQNVKITLQRYPGQGVDVEVLINGSRSKVKLEITAMDFELSPLFSNIWIATQIWPGSIQLASFLVRNPRLVIGRAVVELGAGVGLPGILTASTLSPAKVILTELDEMKALLQRNVVKNGLEGLAEVRNLDWTEVSQVDALGDQVDVVICSDCVFEPVYGAESWRLLARTLACFKTQDVVISLTRRGESDGIDGFLTLCGSLGLHLDCVDGDDSEKHSIFHRVVV